MIAHVEAGSYTPGGTGRVSRCGTSPTTEPGHRHRGGAATGMTAPDERRGRRWLIWSFLACPCHRPLTLGLLGTVAGGTALGALLRRHTLLAGLLVAGVWVAGTARGFLLIRRAQRGELTCAVPTRRPALNLEGPGEYDR